MKFLSRAVLHQGDTKSAVRELQKQFDGFPTRLLVFFASSVFDDGVIAGLVRDAFPGAITLGCSSYAELGGGDIRQNSLAAMAFSDDAFDTIAVAAAENLSRDPRAADKALAAIEGRLGRKMLDLEFRTHFGLSLFDGLSTGVEAAMDRVGALTDIIFMGGSASDDFSMRHIRQYLNGTAYRDAALLAVLKPRGPFTLLKTQSVVPLGVELVATRVDKARKRVLEFNGVSAREAVARGIGVAPEELGDGHFHKYSFGIMAEGEPFVRTGIGILEDDGLALFNTIHEGQRLVLMKMGGIIEDTRIALEAKRRELGGVSAILDFDCAHRDMAMRERGVVPDYARLFAGVETAGFATFGELYIANINQTSVMALFA